MQKRKLLSVVLCVILLVLSAFVPTAFADVLKGRITGDGVRMRDKADTANGSNVLAKLSLGTEVVINGKTNGSEAESGGGTVWYNVTYGDKTGFVYGKYIEEITPAPYNADFEQNLNNFPESYRQALREIHNSYPNWVFIADPVTISLDSAIDLEYSASDMLKTKKWIELTYGIRWRDVRAEETNVDHLRDQGRWTFASRRSIAYFMDPRNGLVVNTSASSLPNIFQFLQQSYDSATQNSDGVRTIIKGTFLENGYNSDKDAYVNDIMAAATESGVSPYVIATTIMVEQGKGTSGLISGSYTGYEGYYNFFNYGASGSDIIVNGLEYAKKAGWNTRRAAIIGGAKLYESGYLSVGQDTYYYMDFNVKKPSNIWHQYANSLYDQCTKASNMRKNYGVNHFAALTFKIPVYASMPDSAYAAPTIDDYNNDKSALTGGGTPQDPYDPPASQRRKGDYDGDGEITVKELAYIRMYLMGVKSFTPEECSYLDVSDDGQLTVKDLALVRMYLLGLVTI